MKLTVAMCSIFQRCTNRQRGSMSGRRAKTQLAKRMDQLFPPQQIYSGHLPKNGASKRPIKELTEQEIEKRDQWVSTLTALYTNDRMTDSSSATAS